MLKKKKCLSFIFCMLIYSTDVIYDMKRSTCCPWFSVHQKCDFYSRSIHHHRNNGSHSPRGRTLKKKKDKRGHKSTVWCKKEASIATTILTHSGLNTSHHQHRPVHQMAITFRCGVVSMETASPSEPRYGGCCWGTTGSGGWRRTTIWALDPCDRISSSSFGAVPNTGTPLTSTSLQTCKKRSGDKAVNIGKQPAFKLKTGKSHLMPSKWERGYLAGMSLQAEAGPISNAHLKRR